MRHVIRDGGSNAARPSETKRVTALAATFLLLVAGVVVSAPGLMTANADGSVKVDNDHHGDDNDQECENQDKPETEHDGHNEHEGQNDDEGQNESQDEGQDQSKDQSQDQSQDDSSNAATFSATSSNDNGGEDANNGDDNKADDEGENQAEDQNDGGDHDDDACIATIEVHKVIGADHGGSMAPSEFALRLDDQVVQQSVDITVEPGAHTVSEDDIFGYELKAITCTDALSGAPVSADGTLTIAAGEHVSCEVVNDEVPPTITLHKEVVTDNGGTAVESDFALTVNGDVVPHDASSTIEMANQPAVISEEPTAGYATASIECSSDIAASANNTSDAGESSLSVVPVLGENIDCTITNDDIAPTVTIHKVVVGSDKLPSAFQMLLGGANAKQDTAIDVDANTPVEVSEVDDANFVSSIKCSDNSDKSPLDNPLTLVEGQNATCVVTNTLKTVDAPVNLVLTKTDDGLLKVAGGASFDYTITVHNIGPGNPSAASTVTDQLPAGLEFVSFPANCVQAGQALTCTIGAADLQAGGDPVVIIVKVRALASAPSGTYTNLAFVDTPGDPACGSADCTPTCLTESNNVDCEDTDITREASISVEKVDDVVGAVNPGGSYSYLMRVTNPGPSTFLANLTLTDDLPSSLTLQQVLPGDGWTCNDVDPLVCHYGVDLQPGTTTSDVHIVVKVDPNFLGDSIINLATAIAIVDPASAAASPPVGSNPGTVVTATDDETTAVVRNADLKIVKTASQPTASAGNNFNWVLDVVNNGPNAATNVVVNDAMPAQFEVIAAFPSAGATCTNTASAVQCTAASLLVGGSFKITVQVRVVAAAAAGTVTNTATVTTSSNDPNVADNTDSESINIVAVSSSPPTPAGPSAGPTPQLPRTGNSPIGGPLSLASLLVAGGLVSLVISRRRRAASA